ncbi:MAG: hypothetical protein HY431_03175 [Candidatus Levybacteria bacterium]|nr:hypothetical protein [Candidatus Levybacteria bacterium]
MSAEDDAFVLYSNFDIPDSQGHAQRLETHTYAVVPAKRTDYSPHALRLSNHGTLSRTAFEAQPLHKKSGLSSVVAAVRNIFSRTEHQRRV